MNDINAFGDMVQATRHATQLLKAKRVKLDMTDENTATLFNLLISAITRGDEKAKIDKRIDELIARNSNNSTSYNKILDSPSSKQKLDLLRHIDDTQLIKQLSLSIANSIHIPVNTVLLLGLSLFSSVSCRKYVVDYQHYGSLPIGMYTIAEHPSGTGKSRCLKLFQQPFFEINSDISTTHADKLQRLQKRVESGQASDFEKNELIELEMRRVPQLFTTNATPEGLEKSLPDNNGIFAAVSSEQGLFNSLFGKTYANGVSNNDVILNAFDGGHISVNRVTRLGYHGNVVGSVVCFAQDGSIDTIIDSSNGTGLSERFQMIAEPSLLGTRKHTVSTQIDQSLLEQYALACQFAESILIRPISFDDLNHLTISKAGFHKINSYRDTIEPYLADNGKYSYTTLRGAAGKIDMQIMKMAANLHLLDGGQYIHQIDDKHIDAAIGIANELLENQLKILQDKGIIGLKAEYESILSMFEVKTIRSEREIIQAKRNTKPFKDFNGNIAESIRQSLEEMTDMRLLIKSNSADGKVIFQLGQ